MLDLVALFSGDYFDEDVIICAFSAIISLLTHEKSKVSMGLAMNINRPELLFGKYNFSKRFSQKLGDFLAKLINTKEFYNSVRSPDISLESSRAYVFRYNI